jgi:hypothetical protein
VLTTQQINNLIASSKTKSFSEKLWFCGIHVGEISGRLTFFNVPILYQMKVGVLTKKGIILTSKPILEDDEGVVKDLDKPLKKIINLKDRLIRSDTGRMKQRLTQYEKIQLFSEINALLQKSEKNSMMSFIYNNE